MSGDYDISAKLTGFKEVIRKGVRVGAGDHINIDMKLEVGDAATSVQVTAEASMVSNENASVGSSITTKEVEDLPFNGGSPLNGVADLRFFKQFSYCGNSHAVERDVAGWRAERNVGHAFRLHSAEARRKCG